MTHTLRNGRAVVRSENLDGQEVIEVLFLMEQALILLVFNFFLKMTIFENETTNNLF